MRSWTSPASLIWLAGHIIAVLLGVLCMTAMPERLLAKSLSESIGGGLIATGVVGMTLYVYVRSTETLQDRLEVISDAGLVNIFRHRSVRIKDQYDSRLRTAKRIDLIGLGLSSFREDYKNEFAHWSHRAEVRILVIDPDFPSAEQSLSDHRDLEEGGNKGEIRADVEAFESEVHRNKDIDRSKFKVRKMRTIPAINLLRIDDHIFWGPYLMSERSRNTPTLLVRRGGFMFDELERHFEATWKAATAPN